MIHANKTIMRVQSPIIGKNKGLRTANTFIDFLSIFGHFYYVITVTKI